MSTKESNTTEPTPLYDAISAACRPGTADLGHIAKQIGMTPSEAFEAVCSAEEHGHIRHTRYGLYEAVSR